MPIDHFDIGCPACGATYTASESHHCPSKSIADLVLERQMETAERPYRVIVRLYDGDRIPMTVSAIGPKGARATALEVARQKGLDPESVVFIEVAA